jgi:hypothetical protein
MIAPDYEVVGVGGLNRPDGEFQHQCSFYLKYVPSYYYISTAVFI